MTLIDLHKILGDRINVTLSEMSPEDMKRENEKTSLIIGLSKQMIANQNTIMKAASFAGEAKELKKTASDLVFLRKN